MTIVEFLNARLDEAEAAANSRYTHNPLAPPVDVTTSMGDDWVEVSRPGSSIGQQMSREEYVATFLVPAPDERVLADVRAKRRMTERAWLSVQYTPPAERTVAEGAQAIHAFWVLAELASVYSYHPDYDPEWKP